MRNRDRNSSKSPQLEIEDGTVSRPTTKSKMRRSICTVCPVKSLADLGWDNYMGCVIMTAPFWSSRLQKGKNWTDTGPHSLAVCASWGGKQVRFNTFNLGEMNQNHSKSSYQTVSNPKNECPNIQLSSPSKTHHSVLQLQYGWCHCWRGGWTCRNTLLRAGEVEAAQFFGKPTMANQELTFLEGTCIYKNLLILIFWYFLLSCKIL